MISLRKHPASNFYILAVTTCLLIYNVRSLRVSQNPPRTSRINIIRSAAHREGQFELADYVNSNFLPQFEDGVISKLFRAVDLAFITRSSALQEYSGEDEKYLLIVSALISFRIWWSLIRSITYLVCGGKLESKSYVILVDLLVRSTEDLDLSCGRFPFWSKVSLITGVSCNYFFICWTCESLNKLQQFVQNFPELCSHYFKSCARNCWLRSKV